LEFFLFLKWRIKNIVRYENRNGYCRGIPIV